MEIIYCKDCIYWKPEHIKQVNGIEREYTKEDKESDPLALATGLVSIDVGINIGAQCFYEYNRGWRVDKTVYRNATDYCSRAERGRNYPLNKERAAYDED